MVPPKFGGPPGFGAPPSPGAFGRGSTGDSSSAPPKEVDNSKHITIRFNAPPTFKADKIIVELKSTIGVRGHRMQSSNGTFSISINYDGDIDRAAELINFGKVERFDRQARIIEVKLNPP